MQASNSARVVERFQSFDILTKVLYSQLFLFALNMCTMVYFKRDLIASCHETISFCSRLVPMSAIFILHHLVLYGDIFHVFFLLLEDLIAFLQVIFNIFV